MKELFIKILRFLMFVLVVALGCIGYNIYEDTLAAVWIQTNPPSWSCANGSGKTKTSATRSRDVPGWSSTPT